MAEIDRTKACPHDQVDRIKHADGSEFCRACNMELFGPYRRVEEDDKIERPCAAADLTQGPPLCNVCGEDLHMGCCNPGRPAASPSESGGYEEIMVFALTDAHVAKLEQAIRAAGYDILADPATGDVRLEKRGAAG